MICIYHSRDLDGYCSAAIVKKKHPEAVLVGYDYGEPIPWDKIPEGSPVIMVDVSLPMDDMKRLAEHSGGKLLWIDHHISAINEYAAVPMQERSFLVPFLKNGISAAELTWEYLFSVDSTPKAVTLLGEYDTWRKEDRRRWDMEILPFQFGMRTKCNSPETFPVKLLENTARSYMFVEEIIKAGHVVLEYQAQTNKTLCRRASFEASFMDLRAICVNACGVNSDAFKSVWDEEKYDVMMPFFFDGTKWIFSLYTTKDSVDCSLLAKSMGGGGHKKAAGFESSSLEGIFVGMKRAL